MSNRPTAPTDTEDPGELLASVQDDASGWLLYLRTLYGYISNLETSLAERDSTLAERDSSLASVRIALTEKEGIVRY